MSTRRSLSLSGLTYQRLRKHCDELGVSVASFLEKLIEERLDEAGTPVTRVLKSRPKHPERPTIEEIASQHFTF